MIKREFKVNFKSFLIWTSILLAMFIFVFAVYPFMFTDETIQSMDEMMKMFPEELLKSFNMDITSITTAYGWVKSEGFMYVLLLVGFYSSILGMNIVLREESDKTIEYLGTLPVKRNQILTSKIIVAITYIVFMILIVGIVNYGCLLLSGNFDHKQFILLSITPIFIGLPFFAIHLFLSMFFHRTKGTIGVSLGIVFVSYLFSMIAELSKEVEKLKYVSIYTLADTRNVIMDVAINPLYVILSFVITIIFIVLSYRKYNRKELI